MAAVVPVSGSHCTLVREQDAVGPAVVFRGILSPEAHAEGS